MIKDEHFNIFPNLISEHIDELHSGELHKGRFIGLYMEEIHKLNLEDHEKIHMKYPQFVSNDSDNRENNWLDYVVTMDDNEFGHFKNGLNEEN